LLYRNRDIKRRHNILINYSEYYYNKTKSIYNGNKINFILNDISITIYNRKTIFFLDGHWLNVDTGHSAKDCPLEEEITHIIIKHFIITEQKQKKYKKITVPYELDILIIKSNQFRYICSIYIVMIY
jgi:hypothetical protein